MGYFSQMSIEEFEDTYSLKDDMPDDEFEIEFLIHQTRASAEGFVPLTREQFYAAARAAIAKIDALLPQLARGKQQA